MHSKRQRLNITYSASENQRYGAIFEVDATVLWVLSSHWDESGKPWWVQPLLWSGCLLSTNYIILHKDEKWIKSQQRLAVLCCSPVDCYGDVSVGSEQFSTNTSKTDSSRVWHYTCTTLLNPNGKGQLHFHIFWRKWQHLGC